jgi:hypothetical protein
MGEVCRARELFYVSTPDTNMMSVRVRTTPTFAADNPTKLFDGPWYTVQAGRTYDVARDGRRFLMIRDTQVLNARSIASTALTVVLNVTEELKAKLPSR